MIQVRRSEERGHANHGWLDSYHSFSFANYYDPQFMGFRDLRVINEDRILGGGGFPQHPHKDMEIITYVIDGELSHKDTLGNAAAIRPGEVQHMSAGTGIQHSEFNSLSDSATHLLQIWIQPEKKGIAPQYGQRSFAEAIAENELTLVVSKSGRLNSLPINQDLDLYVGRWTESRETVFALSPNRYVWLQVVEGYMHLNQVALSDGDGVAVAGETLLKIKSEGPAHFLLFDLP